MTKKIPPHGVGKAPPDPGTVAQFTIEPLAASISTPTIPSINAPPNASTPSISAPTPSSTPPPSGGLPSAPKPKRHGLVTRKDGSQWRKRTVLLPPEYDDLLRQLAGGGDFPTYLAGQILTNGVAELCGKPKPYQLDKPTNG